MGTSVWKGHLTFGLVSIPIRLFAAARSERISLNQLHKVCHSRIRQPQFCPTCNRQIERSEIIKGFEYEKDQYVLFTEEELDKLDPPSARTMEILEFVKAEEVDPLYFDASYFATPEDAGTPDNCFASSAPDFIRARNSSVMPKISITTGSAIVSGGGMRTV